MRSLVCHQLLLSRCPEMRVGNGILGHVRREEVVTGAMCEVSAVLHGGGRGRVDGGRGRPMSAQAQGGGRAR